MKTFLINILTTVIAVVVSVVVLEAGMRLYYYGSLTPFIGAGMSGIAAAVKLEKAGYTRHAGTDNCDPGLCTRFCPVIACGGADSCIHDSGRCKTLKDYQD